MKLTACQDKCKNPVPVLELDVQLQPWHHHHLHQHHHRHHHYHHQRHTLQYVSSQAYDRSDDANAVFRSATRTHHTEDASGTDLPKCSDLLCSSTPWVQGCASSHKTLYIFVLMICMLALNKMIAMKTAGAARAASSNNGCELSSKCNRLGQSRQQPHTASTQQERSKQHLQIKDTNV